MSGTSGTLLDHHARTLLAGIPDVMLNILDIGAGQGKYGRMAREICPNAHLTALEIEPEYVFKFGLTELYNRVIVDSAISLLDQIDNSWDVVIMGDVIEHMPKSQGLDVLHFLVYRTRYMWVQYPERYIQGSLEGHKHEAHLSVWTEADFKGLNADYVMVRQIPLVGMAVNGYLNIGRRVEEILGIFPAQDS